MFKFYILFLFSALVLTYSCGSPPPKTPQNTIRVNLGDEPQTLDPRKARHLSSLTLARMLFEGLVRIGTGTQVELALAESVDVSSDLTRYTFHLREAKWSNGDPITADDFAYAWKKVLDPKYPTDTAFQLYGIKNAKQVKEGLVPLDALGIRILDEKTLEVELDAPTPYFLAMTAFPTFFPVNKRVDLENPHWADTVETVVSNGPFSLSEWKHQDHIVVSKNPSYWDAPHVQIAALECVMVKEETAFKMFEKKELDWVGSPFSNLPLDALSELKKEHALQAKEALATYFLRCNTAKFPLNHAGIRKAFALAANRHAIVEHVTQGGQIPATGLVPPALGLQKEPYFKDADKKGARTLFEQALKECSISRDEFPVITLTYRASERNHLIAQALQQQWIEALAIPIMLEAVEGKTYMDRLSKQSYQLIASDWIADFSDPINFLGVFQYKKSGSNNTHWENREYARLLEESAIEVDPLRRMELLAQSEHILMEEMPIIPLYHSTWLYLSQPEVKDVFLSSLRGIDFKWAHLEQGDKR